MKNPDPVIEVEVERLPVDHDLSPGAGPKPPRERQRRDFGPIRAGILIDLVDFATIGPLQAIVGVPLGTVLGWQMFRYFPLRRTTRLGFAIACGLYCGLLPTNFLPLATLLGVFARFAWPERNVRS